jgi:hypothetical protein
MILDSVTNPATAADIPAQSGTPETPRSPMYPTRARPSQAIMVQTHLKETNCNQLLASPRQMTPRAPILTRPLLWTFC